MGASASTLVGLALAMLLMVGRSGLDRFLPGFSAASRVEVRHIGMAILALGVLGVFITQRSRQGPAARSPAERVCLAATFLCQCWMLTSAAWAPFDAATVDAVGDVLLVLVGYLLVTSAAKRADAQRLTRGIVVGVVVGGGALGLFGVATAIGDSPARLAVLGGGPNVYGRLMALTALFLCAAWVRRAAGVWTAAAAIVGAILVLLSGSRGAMVAMVIAMSAFAVLEWRRAGRMMVGALLAAVVATTVLALSPLGERARAVYRVRVTDLLIERVYTSGRDELYRRALVEGAEHPWIGRGLGAFAHNEYRYPHNLLLESWHASGVIGVGLLLVGFSLGAVAIVRSATDRRSELVAALVLLAVASQFSGDWYDSRGVFWLLPVALLRQAALPRLGRDVSRATREGLGPHALGRFLSTE